MIRLLDGLGWEVDGEDEEGCSVRKSSVSIKPFHDTVVAEAAAGAAAPPVGELRTEDLVFGRQQQHQCRNLCSAGWGVGKLDGCILYHCIFHYELLLR